MRIVNLGSRLIPVGELRVGSRVIAYNPHEYAITREGNRGEIPGEQEMPVYVTDYYLGCFERGALFPLRDLPPDKPVREIPHDTTVGMSPTVVENNTDKFREASLGSSHGKRKTGGG